MGLTERFWAKVDPCRTDGCALWLGSRARTGYGTFRTDRQVIKAHQFLRGKAPHGWEWDHKCKVRNCVWPDHLELVTHLENVRRSSWQQDSAARQRNKTHCSRGHEYNEKNTYHAPAGRTRRASRTCRKCQAESAVERRRNRSDK